MSFKPGDRVKHKVAFCQRIAPWCSPNNGEIVSIEGRGFVTVQWDNRKSRLPAEACNLLLESETDNTGV